MTWSNYDNTHTEIFYAMHSRASLFRSQHKQWLYYIAPCLSHIHSSKRQLLPKEFPIRTNSVEWKVQCIAHVGIRLPVHHFFFLHPSKKHLSNVLVYSAKISVHFSCLTPTLSISLSVKINIIIIIMWNADLYNCHVVTNPSRLLEFKHYLQVIGKILGSR